MKSVRGVGSIFYSLNRQVSRHRVVQNQARVRQPHLTVSPRQPSRPIHTLHERRSVTITDFSMDTAIRYPTVGQGIHYGMRIFGHPWRENDILDLQGYIWNENSFLPTQAAQPLTGKLAVLSDIASQMAITLRDGSHGLLQKNELRITVSEQLQPDLFLEVMDILRVFQEETDSVKKEALAQSISNIAFWVQWLIRGVLFEGKVHGEEFTESVIRKPLSQIAVAANAALGRQQIEFVYDDYTLKAAQFPADSHVNYNDPRSIRDYIRRIETPVGWGSMAGGTPEHNFRHNHSLMERQMIGAFAGWENIKQGKILEGWTAIADASERAHNVFKTMMLDTSAESYPLVRLPIKGVRGATNSVYPEHGVFYEGCGEDSYVTDRGEVMKGMYVDREFGQTGANSSMYKWFDIFIGVAQGRSAYDLSAKQKESMYQVLEAGADPGTLGNNPIDSMQRAFDLLTRPIPHLKLLSKTDDAVTERAIFKENDPQVLFQRLRLAFSVASHRVVHGQYVYKMIYGTESVGGQSRAKGTGGSTPAFLKTFFDQTMQPAQSLISDLEFMIKNGTATGLSEEQKSAITQMKQDLVVQEQQMEAIRQKGLKLLSQEKSL